MNMLMEMIMRRKKHNREPIPKKLRFDILSRDNFTCRYCGQSAPDVVLHADHVKPVAKGGTNEPSNLVAACSSCNGGKSDTELTPNGEPKQKADWRWDLVRKEIDNLERVDSEHLNFKLAGLFFNMFDTLNCFQPDDVVEISTVLLAQVSLSVSIRESVLCYEEGAQ